MRIISGLAVILVTALAGLSLSRVILNDPLPLTLGGATIGLVAVIVGYIFRNRTVNLERSLPPRKLLGLRVGVVGFCVAIAGWLIAVFVGPRAGWFVAVVGVLIGFVGMAIHFANMLRK